MTTAAWQAFLKSLLSRDPAELARMLGDGVRQAHELVRLHRPRGVYEVLDHRTVLTLEDEQGMKATVRRAQRVRFLQDHVVAFTDYAWGDGAVMHDYQCQPGVAVDAYDDGAKRTILISLRETKSRGDVLDFTIRRQVLGGFTKQHEWWETEIYHRTQQLSVEIVFPKERRCARAMVTQRGRKRTMALDERHMRYDRQGRQHLSWAVKRPRLNERYTIAWDW